MNHNYLGLPLILLCLLPGPALSGKQDAYDLSTPEKYFSALCSLYRSSPDVAAIRAFYDGDSGAALTEYEEAARKGRAEFLAFKGHIRRSFRDRVKSESPVRITVRTESPAFPEGSISWSFDASSILEQMYGYREGDIVLLSARESGDRLLAEVLLRGKENTIPLVREKGEFRMCMEKKEIDALKGLADRIRRITALYEKYNASLARGEVTRESFIAVMELWVKEFGEIK